MDTLRILALESSAKAASCAVSENGKITAYSYQNSGLTHSTTLLPMVEDMLKNLGRRLEDMDLIAVAHGPGSFTGIRIGVATAKGLMWGAEKPGIGVSTLEAMAWNCACLEGALICAAMDARRGQMYNALFEIADSVPRRLTEDRAISLDELASELENRKKTIFTVGDGAELCYNALGKAGLACRTVPENIRMQNACGVACAALRAPRGTWGDVEPVYLRLSQAERERLEREKKEKKQ